MKRRIKEVFQYMPIHPTDYLYKLQEKHWYGWITLSVYNSIILAKTQYYKLEIEEHKENLRILKGL